MKPSSSLSRLLRVAQNIVLGVWCVPVTLNAQLSHHALRFYGTGVGPPPQQDRARIPLDDNSPGPGPWAIDVGTGSFTLEIWIRGTLANNNTASSGGDVELWDYSWIDGNILLDRDVWCGTERKWGVSIAGGRVRFGTGAGDTYPDSNHTLEGSTVVLDDTWHHIAVVRDIGSGRKRIYVDGSLDFESSPGVSTTDLSYPDGGVPVTPGQCYPGQQTPWGWYLVLAAEKHDAGAQWPSFHGYVDELRIWNVARSASQIQRTYRRVVASDAPGLVGYYRFEEGTGTQLGSNTTTTAPMGTLIAGTPGNGEWVSRSSSTSNTAPLEDLPFQDDFELGSLELWSQHVP